jgi:hypothetical protein
MSGAQKKAWPPHHAEEVPPYYFRQRHSVASAPERGAITQGKDIGPAFTVLLDEARAVQYIMLRTWISKTRSLNFDTSLLQGFSTEQHGTVGHQLDELVAKFFEGDSTNIRKLEHLGATLRRVCGLRWEATVPRTCTDEEAASGCHGCGARAQSIAEATQVDGVVNERKAKSMKADMLVAESWEWCQRVLRCTPTKDEVRKFRVDRLWLPDLTDAQTIKHYRKNPLPAWYRNGVVYERFEASGPDDARYPPSTIAAVQVLVPHDIETWYARWADEFTAEVGACRERFVNNPELPPELARLIDAVKSFQFGETEARALVGQLKDTATGKHILERMQTGRARLARQLSPFLQAGGNATTTAPATRSTKPRPDLKRVALFHALRCDIGDHAAEITRENASHIAAEEAGSYSKSGGKELLGHFHRYAWGTNKYQERTQDGRPADVVKRYHAVIAMLKEHWPDAVPIALGQRTAAQNHS